MLLSHVVLRVSYGASHYAGALCCLAGLSLLVVSAPGRPPYLAPRPHTRPHTRPIPYPVPRATGGGNKEMALRSTGRLS